MIDKIWEWWFHTPAYLKSADIKELQFQKMLAVGAPACMLVHIFFIFVFNHLHVYTLFWFNFLSVIIWLCVGLINRKGFAKSVLVLATLELITHNLLATQSLGWNTGFHFHILINGLIMLMNPLKGLGKILGIGSFITWFILLLTYSVETSSIELSSFWYIFITVNNHFVAVLVAGILLIYSSNSVHKAELELKKAHQKVEGLLHNILPIPIANRLQAGEKIIADEYQHVSVLFFDVVGFTVMSERMSPSQLVHLLNDLFSNMDVIVEKYQLLKIKTIGDAYMVAAGVPHIQKDHAIRMAKCALDMMDFFQDWKATAYQNYNEKLEVRMGMHSGSLVAGVIGLRNFAYDVWGDTVNVAARMESHGIANHIQISHATYQLIKDDPYFTCDSRGLITIKGKGNMEVYLLKKASI